jgi:hypothetical protein
MLLRETGPGSLRTLSLIGWYQKLMQHCPACKCQYREEWDACPSCKRTLEQAARLNRFQNITLIIAGSVLLLTFATWLLK